MIVDDFPDIHSRMKGELKQQKPPKCAKCGGVGTIEVHFGVRARCECTPEDQVSLF